MKRSRITASPASNELRIRPFDSAYESEGMVGYFVDSSDEDLRHMGIDLDRVPSRDEWLAAVLDDLERPDEEKERHYVGWRLDGRLVGHSSLSHIRHGESGHCHLHLWDPSLRRSGLGTRFLAMSIDHYFHRFELELLVCEPRSKNAAPNAALGKLGFRLVRCYRTVATEMSREIAVNRHEISRDEWADLRLRVLRAT